MDNTVETYFLRDNYNRYAHVKDITCICNVEQVSLSIYEVYVNLLNGSLMFGFDRHVDAVKFKHDLENIWTEYILKNG